MQFDSLMKMNWKLAALGLLLTTAFLLPSPRRAQAHGGSGGESPVDPAAIAFDQNVNAQLPLDVTLADETGQQVRLSQYFGKQPVILIFAYYDCPMLCDLALSDLAKNLKELKATPGKDFQVVTVSFNSVETSQMAAAKKDSYLKIVDRPEAASAWHFLVGQQPQVDQLTKAAGFHYQYDPVAKEYAHPTGVIVLTPEGKIERYIFGIDYNATDLRLALLDASDRKTASPIDQVFLLCYHYDPVTGKYSVAINNVIRLAGFTTVLMLGGLLFVLSKQSVKSGSLAALTHPTTQEADSQGESDD